MLAAFIEELAWGAPDGVRPAQRSSAGVLPGS